MIKIVVVDDEPLARDLLVDLIKDIDGCRVVAEAGTLSEARSALGDHSPDVILLDIQLYGESGFDLLVDIPENMHVIFITAYNKYAVRAFDVNALDYLLKPVTPERLTKALRRLDKVLVGTSEPPLVSMNPDDRIYLHEGRKRWFESLSSILTINSDGDYSKVLLSDGRVIMMRRTLAEWEKTLPANLFMRIHRSFIVNLEKISQTERLENGALKVYIKEIEEPLTAGRRKTVDLERALKAVH